MTKKTENLYDAVERRLRELGLDDEQIEFALADWPEGDEHLTWLFLATREEIVNWGEAANWGRADDATELSGAAICYLENPWNGAIKIMRWGEIVEWAEEHVHARDRAEWLREARKAAAAHDSETLGAMIIGA